MSALTPESQKVSVSRKVLIEVIFALLMFGLMALTSLRSTRQFTDTVRKETSVREKLDLIEMVRRSVADMDNGVRGFLLSGDEDFLKLFNVGDAGVVEYLKTLGEMSGESGPQKERVEKIRALVRRAFQYHSRSVEQRRTGGLNAAASFFAEVETVDEGGSIFQSLDQELTAYEQSERQGLVELRTTIDKIGEANVSFVIASTAFTYAALVLACVIVLRDLAERRRNAEALEVERNLLDSIMEAIPDQIFVKDLKGGYVRTNAAHRQYLGVESPGDVAGRSSREFLPREMADREAASDEAILRREKPVVVEEVAVRKPDGGEMWIETTRIPFVSGNRELVGLVGVSSDISERHEFENRLRHFARALQKSNDELQSFASVASHDLQEPLRKIQAFGDRLRLRYAAGFDEQGRDFLGRIMDAAGRMQTLVQDLLKLSRVTSRALPFVECNLADVVRGVLRDLEVQIVGTGARVTVAGLPVIEADPTQMRQLFQNLIANAVKFQKPGVAPEVLVAARSYDNNHGELPEGPRGAKVWEIRVQDNGIGFEQQFAEEIFGPFKRLHTRTEYEGTGIGLSVCRKITNRHHGKIVAQSRSGEGATFIVTLPEKEIHLQIQ